MDTLTMEEEHFYDKPDFNPGGVKDRIDNRDYDWKEIGAAVAPFDWDAGFDVEAELASALNNPGFKLPVKNKNGSGSCGGQAWATLASALAAFFYKTFSERSAKYIYAQTYVPGGGSMGRSNAEIFIKQGVCQEAILLSYDNGAGGIGAVHIQSPLAKEKCVPCEGGVEPMKPDEIAVLLPDAQGWQQQENKKISREFQFKNFVQAIDFINRIADVAEYEDHHPDMALHDYKKVKVELMTHAINGLSRNDFIVAAKINEIM